MNPSSFANNSRLECLVLGHYDLGFDFHEGLQRSKGLTSGEYRNLRMDFITLEDGSCRSWTCLINRPVSGYIGLR
jgi:hypothetical protein